MVQGENKMNMWELISDSPWISFFLAIVVVGGTVQLINCIMRHWNIRKHGYPPSHCDADGDFRETDKEK